WTKPPAPKKTPWAALPLIVHPTTLLASPTPIPAPMPETPLLNTRRFSTWQLLEKRFSPELDQPCTTPLRTHRFDLATPPSATPEPEPAMPARVKPLRSTETFPVEIRMPCWPVVQVEQVRFVVK